MRNGLVGLLMFIPFAFCGNLNLLAQKTGAKNAVDSNKDLTRSEKIPCPLKTSASDKPVTPLSYYNFNSNLSASFTFLDSSGKATSKTDYTYYFDNSSCFFALKECYNWKNQQRVSFRIEELKDSIGFRVNLNDTSKTLVCKNYKNCNTTIVKYKSVPNSSTLQYIKTGKTKNILGFLCEEMVYETEQVVTTLWVSAKENKWINKVRKDLQYALYNELIASETGIVLISESYYKQTKHIQRFTVTDINTDDAKRVTTDGLKLVGGF